MNPYERLKALREQEKRLMAEWERNVLFAGPAAPNRRLNECSEKIRRLEKELSQECKINNEDVIVSFEGCEHIRNSRTFQECEGCNGILKPGV